MIGAPQPTSRPQTREQKRGGWIQDLLLHKEKEREFVEASNCAHTLNRARVASDVVNIFFFLATTLELKKKRDTAAGVNQSTRVSTAIVDRIR